jgi:membrane glycosyltransferase
MNEGSISADLPPVAPSPPADGATPPSAPAGEGNFLRKPLITPQRRQRRRFLFFSLVVLITGLATSVLGDILWSHHISTARVAILVLFIPLCAMVALGFVQACAGFMVLARGHDGTRITRTLPNPVIPDNLPVTALVMPIYNENVREVYEGLRVICNSLDRIGALPRFDVFILSDSNDPNKWIEEEAGWVELCKQLKGFGRIFYRRRRMPINRKSGNLADFCRRWGGSYRYMVVLDADSVMAGRTLVNMVALMEANPRIGIIQSAPVLVGGTTPFARLMQFASAAYGPIFSAGQHYWQLDEGNYWGHNAIIRLAPFIEHCGLPDVPGAAGAAAKFMSHDYVEAALMAKFGYEVWMAYDLPGSFEGGPPTLIDHAKRDLRWCRGNLQHAWLLFAKGFRPISRLHLGVGVFSYVCSLLWLLFLLAGTLHWYQSTQVAAAADAVSTGFLTRKGIHLLPLYLFLIMVCLLLLPKLLASLLILNRPDRRLRFGGGPRFVLSVIIEQAAATLLAPIQMLFNAVFVVSVLLGRTVHWTAQNRDFSGVDWREAMLTHLSHILIGTAWAMLAWRVDPYLFAWMAPVFAGMILSVPLSILLSHQAFGDLLQRAGLLQTPADTAPPREIVERERRLAAYAEVVPPPPALWAHRGFMQVILDPLVNAVHVALLRQRGKTDHEVGGYYETLVERVLKEGPAALTRREQMALLLHPGVVADLHSRIWLLPDRELAPWWRVAMSQYNLISDKPVHVLQP